ncbi:hypothetical protein FKW77_001474 [Venturia effusa]|uniref:RNase III domain-containing protein n=1 Tax=Venturia effusa TaxID=50376 RepID=A0A517L8M0_9PEZI|nr:hypothetical protein FKW77_001474 [Venturia effusa]
MARHLDKKDWSQKTETEQQAMIERAIDSPNHPARLLKAGRDPESIMKASWARNMRHRKDQGDEKDISNVGSESEEEEVPDVPCQSASFKPYNFLFSHKSRLGHQDNNQPAKNGQILDGAVIELGHPFHFKTLGLELKETPGKKTVVSDATQIFDFNDYNPSNNVSSHSMPFRLGCDIHDPSSLGFKTTQPEPVVIDLTGDSDDEPELSNDYEDDLLAELDRVLCLQQREADVALTKKQITQPFSVSKFLQTQLDITERKLANLKTGGWRNFTCTELKKKQQKYSINRQKKELEKKLAFLLKQAAAEQEAAADGGGGTAISVKRLDVKEVTANALSSQRDLFIKKAQEKKKNSSEQELVAQEPLKKQIASIEKSPPGERRAEQRLSGPILPIPHQRTTTRGAAEKSIDSIGPAARRQIAKAEKIIGHVFVDKAVIFEAMLLPFSKVHKIGNKTIPDSNMRLALIGDSILQTLIVEDRLKRGWSTRLVSEELQTLASNKSLASTGRKLGLDMCAYRGEENSPQPMPLTKKLADLVEAVIGAVYNEGGLDLVRPVLKTMGLS